MTHERELYNELKETGFLSGKFYSYEFDELDDMQKNEFQRIFLVTRGEYF